MTAYLAGLVIVRAEDVPEQSMDSTMLLVLAAMASLCSEKGRFVDKDGIPVFFGSLETVAKRSRVSKSSAQRALGRLVNAGLVERKNKRGKTISYRLIMLGPLWSNRPSNALGGQREPQDALGGQNDLQADTSADTRGHVDTLTRERGQNDLQERGQFDHQERGQIDHQFFGTVPTPREVRSEEREQGAEQAQDQAQDPSSSSNRPHTGRVRAAAWRCRHCGSSWDAEHEPVAISPFLGCDKHDKQRV